MLAPLKTTAVSLHYLHAQLDAVLRLPPEDRGALTNHLPMALQALHSLGASPQRMDAFHAHYARRYQGMAPPVSAAPAPDWLRLRGKLESYPALLAHFQQWLERDGMDPVLRQALPDLLSGVAAAAFHGVIRTAHAVESGHKAEMAAALAYWTYRWQPLRPPSSAQAAIPFEDWAARLIAGAENWSCEGPLISIRMDIATDSPVYQDLAGALQPAVDVRTQLALLASLAVERYLASRNFTVLHMVTGMRALRVLLPWVDGPAQLPPVLTRAFVAAYLAARVKPLAAQRTQKALAWPEIIAAGIASHDDHVVKMVHACHEEAAHYGEGLYREAAALALA